MDDKLCKKTYEEIDESIVKIELVEPDEQSSENINLNFVDIPSIEVHHSNITVPRCTKRIHYRPLRSPKCKEKEKRFRPIQPKPLHSPLVLRRKLQVPMMNMTTSNHVSNTVPIQKTIQFVTPANVSNKMNSYIGSNNSNVNNSNINNSNVVGSNMNIVNSNTINDSDNIANIQSVIEEDKIDAIVGIQNSTTENNNCDNDSSCNSNTNNNSNTSNSDCSKYSNNIKDASKSHKKSIELFFESMAQTVLNLPKEIQANIKMQICKVVTEAEIQYYHKSQAKSKTKN